MRVLGALVLVIVASLLAGCGGGTAFPRDVEGTLERATGGVLRVGASPHEGHVEVADDGGVSGPEADLVQAYATSIGATIEWTTGAESELMRKLDHGELDVVVGGLTSDSPWSSHAALTRPYGTTVGPDGKELKLVLATRLGENALLTSLEKFLVASGHTA